MYDGNSKNEAPSLRFEVIQKMNEDVRLNWKESDATFALVSSDGLSVTLVSHNSVRGNRSHRKSLQVT